MEEQERAIHKCVLGAIGPQPMLVNQIVGMGETQKSLDIHVRVPKRKPAIEQIIDVYVKKPCITNVEVLTGKVLVRGFFEAKTIYVACVPSQAVHAVEARRIRFTAEVPICRARCGMDADASVAVEFIDYECDHHCRAHWYKQWDRYYKQPDYFYDDDCDCDDEYQDECNHKHHKKYKKHTCEDDDNYHDCGCKDKHHHDCGCKDNHHHDDDCEHHCPPKKKPRKCCRDFDISIVLKVTAKVFSCREIMLQPHFPIHPGFPVHPGFPALPIKPKG